MRACTGGSLGPSWARPGHANQAPPKATMAGATHPDETGSARKHPLDEVAQRYYAPLLSFFRKRLRDTSEAQDLVQQVFLRLSQHPGLDAVDKPDAYIFQTARSEEHTSELQSLMRSSYAVFCLKKKNTQHVRK